MDAVRLLGVLRPHLEACGARWMLADGFALAVWGSTRATADLDLVVDDGAKVSLLPRLAGEGFETLFDSEGFRNLLHADPALGRLDLIGVEGTTARKLFGAVSERPGPGGLPVPVPKPERLVAMKSGRSGAGPRVPSGTGRISRSFSCSRGSTRMKPVSRSSAPDASRSGGACVADPEWLVLDKLPIATGAVAEALERDRPGPMTLEEHARFVKGFAWTAEQLRTIPTSEGLPRFTLDD